MNTKQNKKKVQGIFSFLFRDNDRRQQTSDEAYALCAPSPGLNGPGVNCVLVDQNGKVNRSVRD